MNITPLSLKSLQTFSDHYNIPMKISQSDPPLRQCCWTYNVNYKRYRKSERCHEKVKKRGYVFCQRHHRGAKISVGMVVNKSVVEKYHYFVNIGLIRSSFIFDFSAIVLIEGDQEIFDLNMPAIQTKILQRSKRNIFMRLIMD